MLWRDASEQGETGTGCLYSLAAVCVADNVAQIVTIMNSVVAYSFVIWMVSRGKQVLDVCISFSCCIGIKCLSSTVARLSWIRMNIAKVCLLMKPFVGAGL